MTEPTPRIELEALRDADTLHLLPTEALIATIKSLAEQLLTLSPNDDSVIDWRRINREQAEQGLPSDLRDEGAL